MIRKRLIFWLPVLSVTSLLGACGSDGVGGSTATVQERIERCHDDFASCDGSSEDCGASAMRCMDGVRGNGVSEDHIADECDALYDLCSTKTEDLAFCEDLRQACFDCVDRYDDDDDDDSDGDTDTDDQGRDDDEDTDDDGGYDDDGDRCDRDHGKYDDDEDTEDEDTDGYDDDDCDRGGAGGSGGTAGSGGMSGTGGSAGSGGMTGTGGSAGTGGTGGTAGTGATGGTGTTVSFALDILPYFGSQQANCVGCHSGGNGPAGVNLDSYTSILAGGDGFPLVVPFDSSDRSAALIPQLDRNHFNGPDDTGFVVTLAQWIDEGALNN